MSCLKCGKNTKDEHVFCAQCLQTMEAYPVKPDVRIQLPNRRGLTDLKKPTRKRRAPSHEELVAYLRSRQRRMAAAIVLLTLLLSAAVGLLIYSAVTPDELEWGKNYTFDDPFN